MCRVSTYLLNLIIIVIIRLNYGDDMTQMLRHWRKRRFSIQEEKRLAEEIELQAYLARLVKEDRERQVCTYGWP